MSTPTLTALGRQLARATHVKSAGPWAGERIVQDLGQRFGNWLRTPAVKNRVLRYGPRAGQMATPMQARLNVAGEGLRRFGNSARDLGGWAGRQAARPVQALGRFAKENPVTAATVGAPLAGAGGYMALSSQHGDMGWKLGLPGFHDPVRDLAHYRGEVSSQEGAMRTQMDQLRRQYEAASAAGQRTGDWSQADELMKQHQALQDQFTSGEVGGDMFSPNLKALRAKAQMAQQGLLNRGRPLTHAELGQLAARGIPQNDPLFVQMAAQARRRPAHLPATLETPSLTMGGGGSGYGGYGYPGTTNYRSPDLGTPNRYDAALASYYAPQQAKHDAGLAPLGFQS